MCPVDPTAPGQTGVARIYTIGHSRHAPEYLRRLLGGCKITKVADVRRVPLSRFNPQFNRDRLANDLWRHGIEYVHLEDLGGLRSPEEVDRARNDAWRSPFLQSYATYAQSRPFLDALQTLCHVAMQESCAIMCAEADWRRCHRQIISDYLILRDFEVLHILSDGSLEPAHLTPSASVGSDGTLSYCRLPQQQLPFDLL